MSDPNHFRAIAQNPRMPADVRQRAAVLELKAKQDRIDADKRAMMQKFANGIGGVDMERFVEARSFLQSRER